LTVLEHIHLVEVYNAGGVAKAAPLAFFSFLFAEPLQRAQQRAQGETPLPAPRHSTIRELPPVSPPRRRAGEGLLVK